MNTIALDAIQNHPGKYPRKTIDHDEAWQNKTKSVPAANLVNLFMTCIDRLPEKQQGF